VYFLFKTIKSNSKRLKVIVPVTIFADLRCGTRRDRFSERVVLGHLSFWDPTKVGPIWSLVLKRESMPLLCVVSPKIYTFCGADFGSTIAFDLQQKLKPFLTFFSKTMAVRSSLGIYSSLCSSGLFLQFP